MQGDPTAAKAEDAAMSASLKLASGRAHHTTPHDAQWHNTAFLLQFSRQVLASLLHSAFTNFAAVVHITCCGCGLHHGAAAPCACRCRHFARCRCCLRCCLHCCCHCCLCSRSRSCSGCGSHCACAAHVMGSCSCCHHACQHHGHPQQRLHPAAGGPCAHHRCSCACHQRAAHPSCCRAPQHHGAAVAPCWVVVRETAAAPWTWTGAAPAALWVLLRHHQPCHCRPCLSPQPPHHHACGGPVPAP